MWARTNKSLCYQTLHKLLTKIILNMLTSSRDVNIVCLPSEFLGSLSFYTRKNRACNTRKKWAKFSKVVMQLAWHTWHSGCIPLWTFLICDFLLIIYYDEKAPRSLDCSFAIVSSSFPHLFKSAMRIGRHFWKHLYRL